MTKSTITYSRSEVCRVVGGLFGAGLRPMVIVSGGQAVTVTPTTKAQAKVIEAYHDAVKRYLDLGDTSGLARLRGRTVTGFERDTDKDPRSFELDTDEDALAALVMDSQPHYECLDGEWGDYYGDGRG